MLSPDLKVKRLAHGDKILDFSAFYQVPPPPPSLAQSQANSAPPVKPWFQGGSRAPGREQQAGSPSHQCTHPGLSSTRLAPPTPGELPGLPAVFLILPGVNTYCRTSHGAIGRAFFFSSCCHHLEVLPWATAFTSLSLSIKWGAGQEED